MTDHARLADRYLILLEGGPPTNYSAWSPDLAGVVATAATVESCVAEMKDAIAFHLEALAEDDDPSPEPTGPGVYVARSPQPAA